MARDIGTHARERHFIRNWLQAVTIFSNHTRCTDRMRANRQKQKSGENEERFLRTGCRGRAACCHRPRRERAARASSPSPAFPFSDLVKSRQLRCRGKRNSWNNMKKNEEACLDKGNVTDEVVSRGSSQPQVISFDHKRMSKPQQEHETGIR